MCEGGTEQAGLQAVHEYSTQWESVAARVHVALPHTGTQRPALETVRHTL